MALFADAIDGFVISINILLQLLPVSFSLGGGCHMFREIADVMANLKTKSVDKAS